MRSLVCWVGTTALIFEAILLQNDRLLILLKGVFEKQSVGWGGGGGDFETKLLSLWVSGSKINL